MAGTLVLDPVTEDASNAELDITDGTNYRLLDVKLPPPDRDLTFAPSADTEGDPLVGQRYRNREIKAKLRVYGSTAANLHANVGALEKKLAKVNREGGTLKWTTPNGSVVFDLLGAQIDPEFGQPFWSHNRIEGEVSLLAKPFWRGQEVAGTDHGETTLPVLIFTETGPPGDVPGLGRLVIDDDSAQNQWFVMWGIQSRYYDSASSAELLYQAESRTAQGGSATAAGPTGASGSGSNVMRNTGLTTTYQSVLSTQASGGGAHLSHVGDFQVWARLQRPTTNTGAVSVALEWATGDFRSRSTNAAVDYAADEREGVWTLANLGQVHLTEVVSGTQRWEGRIIARSTVVGDDIDVDCLWLIPISEGSGEARALLTPETPTSFSARDEFTHASGGDLTTKTAPAGGTWTAGPGANIDANDFQVDTANDLVYRSDVSDTNTRRDYLPTNLTNQLVGVEFDRSSVEADGGAQGVQFRTVDGTNRGYVYVIKSATSPTGWVMWVTPGVFAESYTLPIAPLVANQWYGLWVAAFAGGHFGVWFNLAGASQGEALTSGYSSGLATGGVCASGAGGLLDWYSSATACTRRYRKFFVAPIAPDAAIFASQSLEIRHNLVQREDSTGTIWTPPSKYEGDYLRVPPAGQEGRSTRYIVKASRNDPDTGPDTAIDDISARPYVTSRGLSVPE